MMPRARPAPRLLHERAGRLIRGYMVYSYPEHLWPQLN